MGIGDDQVLGGQVALQAVQRGQPLAGAGAAHDYGVVLHRAEVEGVERLVVLQHHEIGHVHNVADGTQPGPRQPFLQPLRRRADADAVNDRGGVAVAQVGVGDGNANPLADGQAGFFIRNFRLGHRAARERGDFVGHAQHREAVQPVGGKLQVENGIAHSSPTAVRPAARRRAAR